MTRVAIAKHSFRKQHVELPPDRSDVMARMAARDGAEQLLIAMLRYGADRPDGPGLPGLGHTRFAQLCAEHRITILSPEQPKGA